MRGGVAHAAIKQEPQFLCLSNALTAWLYDGNVRGCLLSTLHFASQHMPLGQLANAL